MQSPILDEAFNSDSVREHAKPDDSSRKLDFDLIFQVRLAFAEQHCKSHSMPLDDSDNLSNDGDSSCQSTSSAVPTRANSMSPKPAECTPTGHMCSSTFGNHHWTTIHENTTLAVEVTSPIQSHKPLSSDELDSDFSNATKPTSLLQTLSSPSDLTPEYPASITRAVNFLSTVDELVWRRTLAPSSAQKLSPVSSEENIAALVTHLELWACTAQGSSRT
ncbi:hypothetical protein JVU11DRAFT_12457 [Chiua virens]|nr:hypothetical protein JVU11DRAFT_12457 [Chiua virens]